MRNVSDDNARDKVAVLGAYLINAIFDFSRGDLQATRQFGARRIVVNPFAVRRYSVRRRTRSNVRAALCSDGSVMPMRRAASSNETLSEIAIKALTCASVILRSSGVTLPRSTNGGPTIGSHRACRIWVAIRATRDRKIVPDKG